MELASTLISLGKTLMAAGLILLGLLVVAVIAIAVTSRDAAEDGE